MFWACIQPVWGKRGVAGGVKHVENSNNGHTASSKQTFHPAQKSNAFSIRVMIVVFCLRSNAVIVGGKLYIQYFTLVFFNIVQNYYVGGEVFICLQ